MTILIIDDVETDRMILSSLVGSNQHDILAVDCPVAGLEKAALTNPSLIVVDYMMPGFDGVEFIRRLRRLRQHRHTPVVLITASDIKAVRLAALEAGANDVLLKPFDAEEVQARARNLLGLSETLETLSGRLTALRGEVTRAAAVFEEREGEIMSRLSRVAEYRDIVTNAHAKRAASIGRQIARRMGLSDRFCRNFYVAMQMHDLGKLGVPDAILTKPGPLTAEERTTMEKHVGYGAEILSGSSSDVIRLSEEIALTHHERWDGSGYPEGLIGTAIPLSGRIAAVADVFDALTSLRPYKEAWTPERALEYLKAEATRLFDPLCVAALTSNVPTDKPAIGDTDPTRHTGPDGQAQTTRTVDPNVRAD